MQSRNTQRSGPLGSGASSSSTSRSGSDKKSIVQGHDFAAQEQMLAPREQSVQTKSGCKGPVQRTLGDEKKTPAPSVPEVEDEVVDSGDGGDDGGDGGEDGADDKPELPVASEQDKKAFGGFVETEVKAARDTVQAPDEKTLRSPDYMIDYAKQLAKYKEAAKKVTRHKPLSKDMKALKEKLDAHAKAVTDTKANVEGATAKFQSDVAAIGEARKGEIEGFVTASTALVGDKAAMHLARMTKGDVTVATMLRDVCARNKSAPGDTDIADEIFPLGNKVDVARQTGLLLDGAFPSGRVVDAAKAILQARKDDRAALTEFMIQEQDDTHLADAATLLVKDGGRPDMAREIMMVGPAAIYRRWPPLLADAQSKDESLRWLLGRRTSKGSYTDFLEMADKSVGKGGVDGLKQCVELTQGQRYVPLEVLKGWITSNGATETFNMLSMSQTTALTTEEGAEQPYMDQALVERAKHGVGAGKQLEEKQEWLLRLDNEFEKYPDRYPEVSAEPVDYQGGIKRGQVGAKTGFQTYTIDAASSREDELGTVGSAAKEIEVSIHTHWQNINGKLTSAHIQQGSNGEEINQNARYVKTKNAIIKGLNSAPSGWEPLDDNDTNVLPISG